MSIISGILGGSYNQNQVSASNPSQQSMQKLSQDLQSGNLSGAQSDFATLQASFLQSSSSTASTSTATNPVAQALSQLGSDLKSGNLSSSQKDLSTVQQDIQSHGTPATNHFRPRANLGGSSGASSTPSSIPNSTSNNLATAQQTYANLQQELQQSLLGAGTDAGALLAQSPMSLEA
jgi:hypothetical protein